MKTYKLVLLLAPILLYSASAVAQLSFHNPATNQGVLDQVIAEFSTRAAAWQTIVMRAASWLFWTLGTISFTWTMGMLALKKADIGEFFAEFIRFTLFFGFFYWLLQNGPNFADSIIRSMRQLGDNAAGTTGLSPSGIVNVGFMIWKQAIKNLSFWSPIDSFIGIVLSAGILLLLAVIAVNMLLLLICAWILMYAGIFFLGFGGARWTSDMAINYFKTVLGVAVQLFAMILLVGIGTDLLTSFYAKMTNGPLNFEELGVMLVFCVALLILVSKVPHLLASIITGGGVGAAAGIGNFSAGAMIGGAMGGAAVAAATAATAGAALAAGAANMAGGAQALMSAFSKANAAGAGGSSGDLMAAFAGGTSGPGSSGSGSGGGGGGGGGGGSDLAAAMGNDSSGSTFGAGNFGGGSASVGPANVSGTFTKRNGDEGGSAKSAEGGNGSQGGSTSANSNTSTPDTQGGASLGEGSDGPAPASRGESDIGDEHAQNGNPAESSSKRGNDSNGAQSDEAGASANAKAAATQKGGTSDQAKSGKSSAAAGATAAKVRKVALGTAANLAQGSWDVAKAKGNEIIETAMDRIGETTGGKIATAIKAREAASKPGRGGPTSFDKDSLSAGTDESPDAASEVAAFRDRDSKAS